MHAGPAGLDGIIPALLARKYDAIIASMSITEERKQKVDFTNKYYFTPGRFAAKKGSITDISPEAMKGKKVGVQRATIHDRFLTETYGDAIEIVRYATQDEAYLDLASGRVDALVVDSLAGEAGLPRHRAGQGLRPGQAHPSATRAGGARVPASPCANRTVTCAEQLNVAIAAIRQKAAWEKLKQQYFGDIDIGASPRAEPCPNRARAWPGSRRADEGCRSACLPPPVLPWAEAEGSSRRAGPCLTCRATARRSSKARCSQSKRASCRWQWRWCWGILGALAKIARSPIVRGIAGVYTTVIPAFPTSC